MLLGEKIRILRTIKGYSQEYMASKMNISQNAYSKMETGKSKISKENLKKIGNIMEMTSEEIEAMDEHFIFNNHDQKGGQAAALMILQNSIQKERELYERIIAEQKERIDDLEKKLNDKSSK